MTDNNEHRRSGSSSCSPLEPRSYCIIQKDYTMTIGTDERLPCEKCDDSGYIEYVSGGLGGGRATWRHEICDCICGDDVRRELRARHRIIH